MTPKEYQEQAMRTKPDYEDIKIGILKTQLLNVAVGLAGESGEICEHIKKMVFHGHALDVEGLAEEAGDLMWYIGLLLDAIHPSLHMGDIMAENIDKLKKRYPNGFSEERSRKRDENR